MRRTEDGFTLIELMATLAIVTILGAIALPSYSRLIEKAKFTSAANTIKGDLERAKLNAVKRHLAVAIAFTPGSGANGRYTVFVDNGATPLTFDTGEEVILTRRMTEKIELTNVSFGGGTTARFNSLGLPLITAGSIQVKTSDGTRFRRITLAAAGNITQARSSDGTHWKE